MKPVLEIRNLSKSFEGVKAVDGVSMSILPRTVTSIIGPNGAGKTTLFNLIGGHLRQDTGTILLDSTLELLHGLLVPGARHEVESVWDKFARDAAAEFQLKIDSRPWHDFIACEPWRFKSNPFDDEYVAALSKLRDRLLDGQTLASIDNVSPFGRARLGIGRLWQDIRLFSNMTVLENLLVARNNNPGERLLSVFLAHRAVRISEKETEEQAEQVLEFLHLADRRTSLAKNLSYGQQKLVALGRLLMNGAQLLLLDEPFAGVNPVMIDEISKAMKSLVENGRTVLMIEHNLPRAMDVSDFVHVMDEGKIELSGNPKEVSLIPELKEIYLGV